MPIKSLIPAAFAVGFRGSESSALHVATAHTAHRTGGRAGHAGGGVRKIVEDVPSLPGSGSGGTAPLVDTGQNVAENSSHNRLPQSSFKFQLDALCMLLLLSSSGDPLRGVLSLKNQ